MTAPGRFRWIGLLSHHAAEDEAEHCVRLPIGRTGIPVCARCLALYPVMALVIGLDLAHRLVLPVERWLLAFAAVTPAVVDWSRIRLFGASGPKAIRPLTGALAGVGLGLAGADHLRNPREPWVWALLGAVAAIVALVLFASRTTE